MLTDEGHITRGTLEFSDRLSVSSGVTTVRPPHVLFGDQYIFGMYVPTPAWRSLTASELASIDQGGLLHEISLAHLTSGAISALRVASDEALGSQPVPDNSVILRSDIARAIGQKVLDEALGDKAVSSRLIAASLRSVSYVLPPGTTPEVGESTHRSTTYYPNSDRAIGLHLDTWAHERDFVENGRPFRCVINIGEEPRYVVFINQSPEEISGMIETTHPGLKAEQLLEEKPQEWAQRFLAAQGSHPVLRLTVLPGEAYVMDTHTCIHDGWAVQTASPDVFVILSYISDSQDK